MTEVDIDLFPGVLFPLDYTDVEQFCKFLVRRKSIKEFSGCYSGVEVEGILCIDTLGTSKLHYNTDNQYHVRRQGWFMTLVVNEEGGYAVGDVLNAVKKAAILARLDVEVSLVGVYKNHD